MFEFLKFKAEDIRKLSKLLVTAKTFIYKMGPFFKRFHGIMWKSLVA